MAEIRNYDADGSKNDLKFADAEKSSGNSPQNILTETAGNGLKDLMSARGSRGKARRRLPVFWDVIIGIIMLAIVVGVVVGAYHLFRYFTDDYEGVELEYKIIRVSNEEDLTVYRSLRNKPLYLDTDDGNTLYFGTVISSEVYELKDEAGSDMLVMMVKATVKYKQGEGYTVGDYRIAVGSRFALRSDNMVIEGDVVELTDRTAQAERLAAEAASNVDEVEGK